MRYRSKRTISNLATDASKRLKKPTPPLVSQSSTPANTATPPPPPPLNEANDTSESKQLIKQLPPKGSSTTTFSCDNNDRKAVKPPDHVQQERIRLTAQLRHQKNSVMLHQRHENSRDTINMQQEGVAIAKLSQIGKEARSLQFQAHTMGSNSYANLQADYSDAKAKVDLLKINNSSSSSVDVEDEAFHSLMNGGDIPERPQGFGFGVKKVTFMGFVTNEVLKKENKELSMKNDENTRTLKTVLTQFSEILDAVRKGKASVEIIDAAQLALHMAIPEGGGGASVCRPEAAVAAECDGGAYLCRPEAVVDC
ncbi:Mediator of RNA polymerase II transcription subunit 26 [Bienertia sinuspersici]